MFQLDDECKIIKEPLVIKEKFLAATFVGCCFWYCYRLQLQVGFAVCKKAYYFIMFDPVFSGYVVLRNQ